LKELDDDFDVKDEIVITEETEGLTRTKELSYPFIIAHNGNLHLTYTYGRSSLEHCIISIK